MIGNIGSSFLLQSRAGQTARNVQGGATDPNVSAAGDDVQGNGKRVLSRLAASATGAATLLGSVTYSTLRYGPEVIGCAAGVGFHSERSGLGKLAPGNPVLDFARDSLIATGCATFAALGLAGAVVLSPIAGALFCSLPRSRGEEEQTTPGTALRDMRDLGKRYHNELGGTLEWYLAQRAEDKAHDEWARNRV